MRYTKRLAERERWERSPEGRAAMHVEYAAAMACPTDADALWTTLRNTCAYYGVTVTDYVADRIDDIVGAAKGAGEVL